MSRELPWLLAGAVVLAAMVLLRRPAGMILRLLGRSALGMGVLAILEAAGLLIRRVDPLDSRAYQLELTSRGRKILEHVEMPYRAEVKKVMADFSPAELSMLIRFMERMRKTLNSEE